jgi:hypothetical protein
MLDLHFQVINELSFLGKLNVEGSDLSMRVHKLGDICRLLMLNEKVLQLLHLVEELDCGGIVQMPSMQEILGQELPVTF